MTQCPVLQAARCFMLVTVATCLMSCGGARTPDSPPPPAPIPPPPIHSPAETFTGSLMWKGDPSANGLYSQEKTLTPANVNVNQFGKLGTFQADGLVMGQPSYVSDL